MKQSLLYMTYQGDDFDEGLSYALDLAKMMDRDIAILLVQKKKLSQKFEDLLSEVTCAEENKHETDRQLMSDYRSKNSGTDLLHLLQEKCGSSGVTVNVYNGLNDIFTALKDFLKTNRSIDMVILSPSIIDNENLSSHELNRLLRIASRPVVLAKHAHAV